MPSYPLIEKCKGDIKTVLSAYLEAKLDALDTEYNDGLTLPDVASGDFYTYLVDPSLQTYRGGLPCVIIGAGPSDNVGEEVGGPIAWLHRPHVSYVYRQKDGDTAKLTKVLERTARALAEVLVEHEATMTGKVTISRINYGQPIYVKGTDMMQEVSLELEVRSVEG